MFVTILVTDNYQVVIGIILNWKQIHQENWYTLAETLSDSNNQCMKIGPTKRWFWYLKNFGGQ